MSIFEQLHKNKGTTSSALGKELAEQAINGDKEILLEEVNLVTYDLENIKSKNIRAGAAKIIEKIASKGIAYAKSYLFEQQGVCLSGAAELYLGFIGAESSEFAESVLPILLDAYDNHLPNEMDWILEAFMKIVDNVSHKNSI